MSHTPRTLTVTLILLVALSSLATAASETDTHPHSSAVLSDGQDVSAAESSAPMTETHRTTDTTDPTDASTPIEATLEGAGATDRYEFTVRAGQAIRIVHHSVDVDDVNLTLYGPDGDVLAEDSTRGHYRHTLGAIAETNGTYAVEVESATTDSADYAVSIETRDPDQVDPYEPEANDDRDSALEVDTSADSIRGILAEDEADWYAIDLDEGDRIDTTLSHRRVGAGNGTIPFDVGNGMAIEIVDGEGQSVGQHNSSAASTGDDWSEYRDARQTAVADSSGTYYVRIENTSSMDGFAAYELTVDVSSKDT